MKVQKCLVGGTTFRLYRRYLRPYYNRQFRLPDTGKRTGYHRRIVLKHFFLYGTITNNLYNLRRFIECTVHQVVRAHSLLGSTLEGNKTLPWLAKKNYLQVQISENSFSTQFTKTSLHCLDSRQIYQLQFLISTLIQLQVTMTICYCALPDYSFWPSE